MGHIDSSEGQHSVPVVFQIRVDVHQGKFDKSAEAQPQARW